MGRIEIGEGLIIVELAELRAGVFYLTRFASPQLPLIPLTPQESLKVFQFIGLSTSIYTTITQR